MRDAPGRAGESKAMGKAGQSSVSVAAPCDAAARCFARGGRWIAPARSNLRTAARRGTPAASDHRAPEPLLLERRALRDSSGKAKTESPRAFAPRRSRGDCRRIAGARTAGGSVFVVARQPTAACKRVAAATRRLIAAAACPAHAAQACVPG